MAARLKSEVVSAFKMHGLTLRGEASRYLVEVLAPVPQEDRASAVDRLMEAIQKQQLNSAMIDRTICEQAVQECNADEEEDSDKILTILDAFTLPRLEYHNERKKFLPSMSSTVPCLFGGANSKADLFRDRYTVLHQRTARHELFTPAAVGSHPSEHSKKFQLKPVEFLLGSTAKLGEIIVLGMLTQMKEGKWFLEDDTGAVQLDLTRANFHTGLFTDNCFVLAEGWYEDKVFHVNAFGFPPAEPADKTRAYFGNINFFGGPSATCGKASSRLRQLEETATEAMFVILSDVWLDHLNVMEKLRVLFTGYSEMPPTAFIFCGNFTSQPYGGKHAKKLKELLGSLGEMIAEFSTLVEQSRFIFVPGPLDPGPAHILPRPPIPDTVCSELVKKVPSAVFACNPCRIQYCTKEIVVFREDIVMKMCRNCVRFPSDGDIPTHFAKTLVGQGHLCPLPLHVAPVYWSYDNALRLYPLPDLVVCADKFDPFTEVQSGCTIINPGSFPRSDFSFKVYLPASNQVEESRIED